MRHARPEDLGPLQPLLQELRRRRALTERRPGTFYRGARAFLHFHVDPAGRFADVRLAADWERWPVDTVEQQGTVLDLVDRALAPS